jgi:hypothetical protein
MAGTKIKIAKGIQRNAPSNKSDPAKVANLKARSKIAEETARAAK